MVVHAVEKFGKTSFAAQIPGVIFGMPNSETGLQPLLDSGLLKDVPYMPPWETWEEVNDSIDFLTNNDHPYKALAIDTGNGIEKLLHDYVCRRDYGGTFDHKGFLNYQNGFDVSAVEMKLFLGKLNKLREIRKVRPVMLVHTAVRDFKNPEGHNFGRFETEMHPKCWAVVKQWADIILFGNFVTVVTEQGGKPKGKGGQDRVFHTVRSAICDAGNRVGLTGEIDCGSSAAEAWTNFTNAVKAARVPTAPAA